MFIVIYCSMYYYFELLATAIKYILNSVTLAILVVAIVSYYQSTLSETFKHCLSVHVNSVML